MNFVAVDVETTGTLSYMDHIVELAAVRFSKEEVQDRFSFLVNPGVQMPEEASRINGITNEMLKDKPQLGQVLKPFCDFCSSDWLVAHNAIFDFQFLATAIEKQQCAAPSGPMLDTYALSKVVFPGLSNYKLSTLAEYLKISSDNFHRAEQDAWVCGKLFCAILRRIRDNGYTIDVPTLVKLSGKKELKFPPLKAHQFSLFD